ncbi:GPCR kinase [Trema orientale]|uniref:Receptor-like serine/threonine-protein kinase n=1 Tax=Trema orientale TaxID=63057 RepID=A0A2P5FQY6_TREOI|nr:GPCR kinase [Trema orientale]
MDLFFGISLLYLALSPFLAVSEPTQIHSIHPNFTASQTQFIDNDGAFFYSPNSTFGAALKPFMVVTGFYFSIVHVPTDTVIWSANRQTPVSNAAVLSLSVQGLTLAEEADKPIWSTPPLTSPVSAMQLLETGNLVLVGPRSEFLWQSFDHPTDTIVTGQRLPVGKSLAGAASADDFSAGDYRLTLTGEDLVSQWYGQTYWTLSMDPNSIVDSNRYKPVSFMEMNSTGLYLYGEDKDSSLVIVMRIVLRASSFRIAHLGYDGRFMIRSLSLINGLDWVQELVRPVEFCRIPYICGKLGVCMEKENSARETICTCPQHFRLETTGKSGCLVDGNSFSLSTGCSASGGGGRELESKVPTYLKLGNIVDYFANAFVRPVNRSISLSICQDLCSKNPESDQSGYVKVFPVPFPRNITENKKRDFPIAGCVLVPMLGFGMVILVLVMVVLWLRRKRTCEKVAMSLQRWNSSSSTAPGSFPGLPSRYEYEQLVAATENFSTQIGSGGFGTVYKGTMADKETVVAVKKITNSGVQGKKEFFTEIATIGSIRHANLVRLKCFCIRERQHFLVYEFMNKGSLERILFGKETVLEWRERFKIIYGTARALAYLHSGCHQKIIHCDIKPENILLNDSLQVKVSDFGLSKLLDHKNSKLFTVLTGTRGYLAPEWLTSSGITDKTDVYSFGMVVLEIVSGQRNCSLLARSCSTENEGTEEDGLSFSSSCSLERLTYFPSLALEMHKQKRYLELADPRLEGRVSFEDIEKIIRIALCCIHIVPILRPTMDNVVAMLEGRVPLGEPRVEALNFLQYFGGRQS